MQKFYTSESVSEGHPDKLADFVSDSILDEFLRQEPGSRVAVETLVTTGMAVVAGEVRAHTAHVDVQKTVREAVQKVGYVRANYGFDAEYSAVLVAIHEQSPEIAGGVDHSEEWRAMTPEERARPENRYSEVGAGDQGLMFGYATDETPELMPLPISLAHGLTRRLAELRRSGELPYLRPDAKAQVTVERDGEPHDATETWVDTVVISAQHDEDITNEQLRADLPELPAAKRRRLLEAWGFSELEMRDVINAGLLDVIEETVAAGAEPAAARKWWTGEIARVAKQEDAEVTTLVTPAHVAELAGLVKAGKLNDKLARKVLAGVIDGKGGPTEVMEAEGLEIVQDDGALEAAVDEAIAANPDVVEKIKGGKMQAIGALMGPIMKATRGQADAGKAREMIMAKING